MVSDKRKEYGDYPIENHEYDGIQELNNPLPKWWLLTFYGAIVFSIFYWGYYELAGGPSSSQELASEMSELKEKRVQNKPETPENIDAEAIRGDSNAMAMGEKQFVTHCAACHGQKGEGLVGPNLTDKYWIHSKGQPEAILTAIREGFPTKGMPPWGALVPEEAHIPLAVYVTTLRGTNPPNAKAPQGEPVEE